MPIAGLLDRAGWPAKRLHQLHHFCWAQRGMKRLAEQLPLFFVVVSCVGLHNFFNLFWRLRTQKIAYKQKTAGFENPLHLAEAVNWVGNVMDDTV